MLFRPMRVGPITTAGRVARSATAERAGDEEGRPGEATRDILVALVSGGAPWVTTGHAFVLPGGRCNPVQSGIHTDGLVPHWRNITNAAHEADAECKLFLQISHGGRQVSPETVADPVAPSAVPLASGAVRPREMTPREIEECIAAFGEAGRRAVEAGFDGVQIHCAHGYLLSQFLSAYTNRRTDEWGGTPERRRRFTLEVYRAVRNAVGPGVAVTAKLNCEDFHPEGLTLAESCGVAVALTAEGIDAIEVSGFMQEGDARHSPSREGDPAPAEEGYYLSQAVEIKRAVGATPVGVCGGFRTLRIIQRVVESEGLDFVALSRPFIAEPDLVNRFRAGQPRATCISCNRCGTPLHCPLVADGQLRPPAISDMGTATT